MEPEGAEDTCCDGKGLAAGRGCVKAVGKVWGGTRAEISELRTTDRRSLQGNSGGQEKERNCTRTGEGAEGVRKYKGKVLFVAK
jgi:hypothetical protein